MAEPIFSLMPSNSTARGQTDGCAVLIPFANRIRTLAGCKGYCGRRPAPDHALRADHYGRSVGPTGVAPGARLLGGETYRAHVVGVYGRRGMPQPKIRPGPRKLKSQVAIVYIRLRTYSAVGPVVLFGRPYQLSIRTLRRQVGDPRRSLLCIVGSAGQLIRIEECQAGGCNQYGIHRLPSRGFRSRTSGRGRSGEHARLPSSQYRAAYLGACPA